MTGGRESTARLIKRGGGALNLRNQSETWAPPDDVFRFDAGTIVEGGVLSVGGNVNLISNVIVQPGSILAVTGKVTGGVRNSGETQLWGTIFGDVANDGFLDPGAYNGTEIEVPARIVGNFSQGATGTLGAYIGAVSGGFLSLTGRADLDGTLRLLAYTDSWGPYPLPATPVSVRVLHAGGGVFGQFSNWTSPGLFITGSVRYEPNDVYFDASRISVANAMAASASADALTLGVATRVDEVLSHADRLAGSELASLSRAERQLLNSLASVLRIRDTGQAKQTLDSLSGHAHGRAVAAIHSQAAAATGAMSVRLAQLAQGDRGGERVPFVLDTGSPLYRGSASGFDQWLNPRLLIGSSLGVTRARMPFDRMGGQLRGTSPTASLHVHHRGDDWRTTVIVGAARGDLQMTRPLDLAQGGVHQARSERGVNQVFAHFEVGREMGFGGGRVMPYVALDHSSLRSRGFEEVGDTGLELLVQPAHATQTSATAGARYTHSWQRPTGWLRLDLDVHYGQAVSGGDPLPVAAYSGAPEAHFPLAHFGNTPQFRSFGLGLAGSADGLWTWSTKLGLDAAPTEPSQASHWSFALQRRF